jgi:hypothetical protein
MKKWVYLGLSCLLMVGCRAKPSVEQQQQQSDRLFQALPVLRQLQVTDYRHQDWCKNLVYQRGKFSSNPQSTTCNYLFQGTPKAFDSQAEQDFQTVATAIANTGVNILWVDTKYNPAGNVKQAEFRITDSPYSYVYSPNYSKLPEDLPNERLHTAINKDWYFVTEDWN